MSQIICMSMSMTLSKKGVICMAYIPYRTQITEYAQLSHLSMLSIPALHTSIPDNWVCWVYQGCIPVYQITEYAHPPTPDETKRPPSLFLPGVRWNKKGKMRRQVRKKMDAWQERNDWHFWGRGIDAPWLTHSAQASSTSKEINRKGNIQGISHEQQ